MTAPPKLVLAWLLKEDWPRWQAIDPNLLPYDQWLARMDAAIAMAVSRAAPVVKITIDPSVFVEWCKAEGKEIRPETRAEYAGWQAQRRAAH